MKSRFRGSRPAAGLLALLLAAFSALPFQAEAQSTTLVSNTGQGGDASAGNSTSIAQRFTTGSNSDGYTLTGVDIVSEDADGDSFSAQVCSTDANGYPTSACTSLTAPSGFTAGTLSFTAPAGTVLAASTDYTVVATAAGSSTVTYDTTTSDSEDSGAASNWNIANDYDFLSGGTWSVTGSGESLRIAVKGIVGVNEAPVVANPIPDQIVAVGAQLDYTVPGNAFSDPDGDTLTYSAKESGQSGLPAWLTFTAGTRTFSGTAPSTAATLTLEVTADDSNGGTVTDAFDLKVNAAPTGADKTVAAQEDTDYAFAVADFGFADANAGDVLASVQITSLPAAGALLLNGAAVPSGQLPKTASREDIVRGRLKYRPPANASGTGHATFMFKVGDGAADSASANTMTVDVAAVNDAPAVANEIPDQSATAGTSFTYAFPANTFADADASDTLTYTAAQSDDSTLPTWLGFTPSTRTFAGTPPSGAAVTVSVKVTATDSGNEAASDVFDIVVRTSSATAPAKVTGVAVTAPGAGRLQVSWTELTGADGYLVEWKTGSEAYGSSRQADVSGGATTSYLIDPVYGGAAYTVRVTAYESNTSGPPTYGPASDEATGTASAKVTPTIDLLTADYSGRISPGEVVTGRVGVRVAFTGLTRLIGIGTDDLTVNYGTVRSVTRWGNSNNTVIFSVDVEDPGVGGNQLAISIREDAVVQGNEAASVSQTYFTATPLTFTMTTDAEEPVTGAFTVKGTFSQTVNSEQDEATTGLWNEDAGSLRVHGGTVDDGQPTAQFTEILLTVRPWNNFDGILRIELLEGEIGAPPLSSDPIRTNSYSIFEIRVDTRSNTAPVVTSILRQTPAASPTNADSVTWRVTFGKDVQNVNAADFQLTGAAASLTVAPVSGSDSVYDVTAAGSALNNFDGTLTLNIASGHDIEDGDGRRLDSALPSDAENTWVLDNTAPTVDSVLEAGAEVTIAFNEALAARNPPASAFTVERTPRDGSEERVTVSAAAISGATVTLTLAAALADADTDVKVSYARPSNASERIIDTAGNEAANFVDRQATRSNPAADPGAPQSLSASAGDGQVTLAWQAPADDGNRTITGYQVRHAEGGSVPSNVAWTDVGLVLSHEVTGLTNDRRYSFEVRAANAGDRTGPAASVQATPSVGVPGEARNLHAVSGAVYTYFGEAFVDVTLTWDAPTGSDVDAIYGYQYRIGEDGAAPSGDWFDTEAGPPGALEHTIYRLKAGTAYVIEIRGVTVDDGAGPVERVEFRTADFGGVTFSLYTEGEVREGEPFAVGVRRSGGSADSAFVVMELEDSAFPGSYGHVVVELDAGATTGTAEYTPALDGARPSSRSLEMRIADVPEDTAIGSPSELTLAVGENDAGLRVDDAVVAEAAGARLAFRVRLDRVSPNDVTVEYETADGTATQGQDYTATAGTLTIAAGGQHATVHVPVLNDAHNEGTEALTLTLSNPVGAILDRAAATGTITNTDPMPKAWLARFGRTATDHALEAIGRRMESAGTGASAASHLTIGGRRVDALSGRSGPPHTDDVGEGDLYHDSLSRNGFAGNGFAGGPESPEAAGTGSRRPRLRDLVLRSSFQYSPLDGAAKPGPFGDWAAWGNTAATRFSGTDGSLSLTGDVTTATAGIDTHWNRWFAGVALSYSEGSGAYTDPESPGGAVASTLASLSPYARYRIGDRASVWGALGFGTGELSLAPELVDYGPVQAGRSDAPLYRTGIANRMAAVGGNAEVLARFGAASEFRLEVVSDLRLTQTRSKAASNLVGVEAGTGRARMLLKGSGAVSFGGFELLPTLEAGLRYDTGDAETGAGFEVGAGLGYSTGRLAVQFDVRGLLAHEEANYGEWGVSGMMTYAPGTDGRGLTMSLGSTYGAAQSGIQDLWSGRTAAGFARGGAMPVGQSYQGEIGYALEDSRGRALWTPYIGADAAGYGGRRLRMGLKVLSGDRFRAQFGVSRQAGAGPQNAGDALEINGIFRF